MRLLATHLFIPLTPIALSTAMTSSSKVKELSLSDLFVYSSTVIK